MDACMHTQQEHWMNACMHSWVAPYPVPGCIHWMHGWMHASADACIHPCIRHDTIHASIHPCIHPSMHPCMHPCIPWDGPSAHGAAHEEAHQARPLFPGVGPNPGTQYPIVTMGSQTGVNVIWAHIALPIWGPNTPSGDPLLRAQMAKVHP